MITVFADDPPLGTRITLDDQPYELVDIEPYIRKLDGARSRLLIWETICPAAGCGDSFRVITGLSIRYLQRRCETHKRSLKPVKGRRGRKVRARIELP